MADLVHLDISICPTETEFTNGDRYDELLLLDAIRLYANEKFGNRVVFDCLQVGHRQGDKWNKLNGSEDDGEAFMVGFFNDHGNDEDLYIYAEGEE
jgi:hypothetical protein